jgi:hypothetical protein
LGMTEVPVTLCDEWSEAGQGLPPHGQSLRRVGCLG